MNKTGDVDAAADHVISKRAIRRHHKQRMKAKARYIAGVIWRYAMGDTKSEEVVESMERNADHLKACSCEMCRNPRRSKWRKNKGKTIREEQADDDLRESQRSNDQIDTGQ